MSRLITRTTLLFILVVIVGAGDASQMAWAQNEVVLDDTAMAKECSRARDHHCRRVCLNAVRGYVGSDECRTAYNQMKARQPESAVAQAVQSGRALNAKG
mgnify:FL=1